MHNSEGRQKTMKEMENDLLQKVGDVITSINGAKNVGEVIGALHSFAVVLFPVDSHSVIGSTRDNKYIDQALDDEVSHSESERRKCWEIFYKGPAFPTLARVLLYDVAFNWLSCFPVSARKNVYDLFFVNGCVSEVVQVVVPCLQHSSGNGSYDVSAVSSNAQRLLVLSLVDNHGVLQITKEIASTCQYKELTVTDQYVRQTISNIVRSVTSIPDKAPPGSSVLLSSSVFFDQIVAQLLHQSEEFGSDYSDTVFMDCIIIFTAETFVRICRRGSVDLLLKNFIPKILGQVRSLLLSVDGEVTSSIAEFISTTPGVQFWSRVVESMKDSYAIETMSERLLHQLALQNVNDTEAYWILWIMFHQIFEQNLIKTMFVDKLLFWKVFPLCCLRWILHFAVFQCSPQCDSGTKAYSSRNLSDMVQRLVVVWSKSEFVQSASLEQQAYMTSALGLCLEKMSKEDLNTTKEAIRLILQGVSCRLERPDHLTRKMASSIALAFSKVIDPQNPLYLDDDSVHEGGVVDWDFGLITIRNNNNAEDAGKVTNTKSIVSGQELIDKNVKGQKKRSSEYKLVDPDEVIDPAILNVEQVGSEGEEDDLSSEHSDDSSDDSSLQPYDLTDDDSDLQKKFAQLVDVVGALRKSDDPDNVEKALAIIEHLVRASPDELKFVAADLVRTLVQVRCSDLSIEGEELSVEEKRQRALVALAVKCPMGSLETLHNLLYSPNVDVSQRIMILDVLTEAALELSRTRTSKPDNHYRQRPTISSVSDQPWFVPKTIGASPWKEISTPGTPLNWSNSYERELPSKLGHIKKGKTRRWNLHTPVMGSQRDMEWSHNEFPQYVAAFMLPAMKGFDKKSHGVDLLGRDFIVLGKLIYMLGVCIKCAAMHPEASVLASPLLDMLSMKDISHHKEAFVRRSVLFAASCVLVALHPTYIASSLVDGNTDLPKRLDWIRAWANHVAESDTDKDCYTLAMTCLQLHSEMALQTSRALESTENTLGGKNIALPSKFSLGISKISF